MKFFLFPRNIGYKFGNPTRPSSSGPLSVGTTKRRVKRGIEYWWGGGGFSQYVLYLSLPSQCLRLCCSDHPTLYCLQVTSNIIFEEYILMYNYLYFFFIFFHLSPRSHLLLPFDWGGGARVATQPPEAITCMLYGYIITEPCSFGIEYLLYKI